MDIKELKGHFDQAANEMKSLVERQTEELKKYGTTTDETAKQMKSLGETLDSMQDEVKKYDERIKDMEAKSNHPGFGGQPQISKSIGQQFVESEAFSNRKSGQKSISPVDFGSSFFRKDITSASASAGALVQAMRLPEIYADPADRTTHIRQFMNTGTTSSNAIEFMKELLFTNNAGPQYVTGQTPPNELVAKNKSDITFDLVSTPVQTLAHYIIASRQILDDASMLRNYIDGRLTYGLALEEDTQILYGTGSNGDLEGIMVNADVQDAGGVATGDNLVDHIRKSIAMASLSHYVANGIILNPTDFANIELLKGDDGHYIWVTVPNGGEAKLWRVPVYETTAINAGEFLLGNWSLAGSLWDREQTTVRVAEQHADLFIKNGVAVLAEERLAMTIYRPQAFVKGVFTAAV